MSPMAAPRPPLPRPIQPSVRRQLAQFLSLLDPRCEKEQHNKVAQGEQCSACHRDLWTYIGSIPEDWPA